MYEYEFHTIHTNTVGVTNKSSWTSMLFAPIHNVVQVSVLNASIDSKSLGNGFEVVFLSVDQFKSPFNDVTGQVSATTTTPGIVSSIQDKDKLRNALAVFHKTTGPSHDRIIYDGNDFSTQTQFKVPIDTVDRLTQTLYDQDGKVATMPANANNFITYRITSLKTKI